MKKKLLIINVSLNKGSTGRIAEQIGEMAKHFDYEVYYAHGARYVCKSEHKTIQIGSLWEEYIHAICYSSLLGIDGFGSKIATKKLISVIESIRPDIVHLHNIHGHYINVKVLFEYLYKYKIPIVWTLHDCWCFTGGCSFLNKSKCEKWQEQCYKCPLRPFVDFSKYLYDLKKNLFANYRNIILVPVSNWLDHLLKKSFMKFIPSHTIYNGIDLNVFKPVENNGDLMEIYPIQGKQIILGVAAPWSKRKGFNDFLAISHHLADNQIIVLIGLDDKQIRCLPSNIVGIKRTENVYQLASWYSLASVFVNPTYSDNFPTTNIESLACGTPIVTYNTGGSPEAIDEETGIVVNQGDLGALEDAIKCILAKNKSYYKENCRLRALKLFNKDECFMNYIEIYNTFLNETN